MVKKEKTHRDIGVDAKAPEKTCNDPKCCWHGKLPIRGKIFTGKVVSDKASKTAIVEWGYHHYIPKYERSERRHSRVVAYNPSCIGAKTGETVRIAECRPISKTKSFIVIERLEK